VTVTSLSPVAAAPALVEPVGTDEQLLDDARSVIAAEGQAVLNLANHLGDGLCQAAHLVLGCRGRVVVTGMGKSGIVAQKISATLASTGTPSLFLHAAEAVHGDLGRITPEDVVIALSNSGNSEEVVRLIKPIKTLGAPLIAMTRDRTSLLARHADVLLHIGDVTEACPMGIVPTASTTAMMVLGDALAVSVFNRRGFSREDYARFHPGGQLGRQLMKVREVMRSGGENPLITAGASIRQAISVMSETPGRPGAVSVTDKRGKLVGFFTDGDLRRLVLHQDFSADAPIESVMHRGPKQVHPEQLVAEATRILREHKIDQVPVVDDAGAPVGLIDVQDLLSTR